MLGIWDKLKEEFDTHLDIIFNLLFDTLVLIVMILCFVSIDFIVSISGFKNDFIISFLDNWGHPIIFLTFFSISLLHSCQKLLWFDNFSSKLAIVEEEEGKPQITVEVKDVGNLEQMEDRKFIDSID